MALRARKISGEFEKRALDQPKKDVYKGNKLP